MQILLPARLVLSVITCVASAGCAPATFDLGVDALTGRAGADLRTLTIGVVPNDARGSERLAPEVGEKIERLLESNGYTVVSPDSADVLILNGFGRGSSSEGLRGVLLPHGNMLGTFPASAGRDLPWLMLAIARATDIAGPEAQPQDVTWLWIAEVTSTGRSGEFHDIIDYMLIAAFEHFGRQTGRGAVVRLTVEDGRVAELRGDGG
ncbi:MAG: hypothetical protein WD960_09120 [Gemmatimonadota bacterium]